MVYVDCISIRISSLGAVCDFKFSLHFDFRIFVTSNSRVFFFKDHKKNKKEKIINSDSRNSFFPSLFLPLQEFLSFKTLFCSAIINLLMIGELLIYS